MLRLPLEIRVQIYKLSLPGDQELEVRLCEAADDGHHSGCHLEKVQISNVVYPLLRVNSQIRAETRPFLMGRTFYFASDRCMGTFLKNISERQRGQISMLKIHRKYSRMEPYPGMIPQIHDEWLESLKKLEWLEARRYVRNRFEKFEMSKKEYSSLGVDELHIDIQVNCREGSQSIAGGSA